MDTLRLGDDGGVGYCQRRIVGGKDHVLDFIPALVAT
jgi:hypothetical protein